MRNLALGLIKVYRYAISPLMASHCRFYPSCSCYAQEAIEEYGLLKGVALSARRLGRCHPWNPGGYDPVPTHSDNRPSQMANKP
ncbi:MAG TPA: membrane protein insertion efficiency factor YidD [Pseudomonas sabulinigri]|nr:membrane protein insertion efficiency factor YidD [Halopseudomonas sabulinigri]HEC52775.1 membrane protein insertion efficiency factor YidD [Halopseudomonas sabulinigri]